MLDPHLQPFMRKGTFIELLMSIYFQLTITVSMVASTALAICRFISIKFPFYAIKKTNVFLGCSVTFMILSALWFAYAAPFGKTYPKLVWFRYNMHALYYDRDTRTFGNTLLVTRIAIHIIMSFIAIIVSILSILELKKSSSATNSSRENIKKSSIVVACININNGICFVGLCLSVGSFLRFPALFFLSGVGVGIIGAAFNPSVRIMGANDIYKHCKSFFIREH